MNKLEKKYEQIFKEAHASSFIIGLIFGGSRGKSAEFLTENSDYDVVVIVANDAPDELKKSLKEYKTPGFEIWVKTLGEFKKHASWGSAEEWDRYNYTYNKAIIDKTGEIQNIINEKGMLPKEVQREVIETALDDYINQVYRSAKYWRDGNTRAAYFDATESLPSLMTALYALEGRLKPYNKYFEWELKNYPLRFLPWSPDEFIKDYEHILRTGDIKTQKKILNAVKKIFQENGYTQSIDAWKGYFFVGE